MHAAGGARAGLRRRESEAEAQQETERGKRVGGWLLQKVNVFGEGKEATERREKREADRMAAMSMSKSMSMRMSMIMSMFVSMSMSMSVRVSMSMSMSEGEGEYEYEYE